MSLSTRLSLWITGILTVFALSACVAAYMWMYRSWSLELESRFEYRFGSLSSTLELDGDTLELELNPDQKPKDAAEYWRVEAPGGQVLWSEEPPGSKLPVLWKYREFRVPQLAATRERADGNEVQEEIQFSLEPQRRWGCRR